MNIISDKTDIAHVLTVLKEGKERVCFMGTIACGNWKKDFFFHEYLQYFMKHDYHK